MKNKYINHILVLIHTWLSKLIGKEGSIKQPSDIDLLLIDNASRLHNTLKDNTTRLASALLKNDRQLSSAVENNISNLQTILLNVQSKPSDLNNDSDEFKTTFLNSIKRLSDIISEDRNANNIAWSTINQSLREIISSNSDKLQFAVSALEGRIIESVSDKLSHAVSGLENKIAESISDKLKQAVSGLEEQINESVSDKLWRSVSDLESKVSEIVSNQTQTLYDDLVWYNDQPTTAINKNFASLDEKISNYVRRDRRAQQALEYLVSGHEELLNLLQTEETATSKQDVISFADNFILFLLTFKQDQTTDILYKKFNLLLKRYGLSIIADKDVQFDPDIHSACDSRRNLSKDENIVLRIITPGYYEHGKLMRAATVVVNRWNAEIEDQEYEDYDDYEGSGDSQGSKDVEFSEDSEGTPAAQTTKVISLSAYRPKIHSPLTSRWSRPRRVNKTIKYRPISSRPQIGRGFYKSGRVATPNFSKRLSVGIKCGWTFRKNARKLFSLGSR